jgi:lysophospholipase L1-like esterase
MTIKSFASAAFISSLMLAAASVAQQTEAPPTTNPTASSQPAVPAALHPALFLVGDSIMGTGKADAADDDGPRGYGWELIPMFDPAKVHVYNQGKGGRSSRGYIDEGSWAGVLSQIQPGDWVIVDFGHNDAANSANYPDRVTGKGNGDELSEVETRDRAKKSVHSFGWYMRQYAREAKAKGAAVIICSPVPRNKWADGKIKRGLDGYADWAAQAASAGGASYIDLNTLAADRFDALGQDAGAKLFFDSQHLTREGARLAAECVVAGLRELKDCSLKDALSLGDGR